MLLTPRAYQNDEDFWRIRDFLRQAFRLYGTRQRTWSLARFDYWRWHGVENIDHFRLEEVITLWESPDGQIAAVLNPEGPGEAFFQVHPEWDIPELEAELLAAAEERLAAAAPQGGRRLVVWACEDDTLRRDLLQARGYTLGRSVEYMRWRSMGVPIPEAPLAGYSLRALGDGAELLERCYASGLVFHPDNLQYAVDNRADVSWYRNIQNAPLYRRDLDLVAVAADGAVAAFCTIWFDDVNRSAVFEPVGTAPAHQRRGLGRAVMAEGLRRLRRAGATLAFVSSYSIEAGGLYEAMGFTRFVRSEPWIRVW